MSNNIILPTSIENIERNGKIFKKAFFSIEPNNEKGFHLYLTKIQPLKAKIGQFYRQGEFLWTPFNGATQYNCLEGANTPASNRYNYPGNNQHGVIYYNKNNGQYYNMTDNYDDNKFVDFDFGKLIFVNVNDVRGGYTNNIGIIKFTFEYL